MSFTSASLKLFKPSIQATSFTTPNIGGGPSANEALPANISEIMLQMPVLPSSDRTQYAKCFLGNTDDSEAPTAAKIYLANALDDWGDNNSTAGAKGDVSGDDDGKFVRLYGHDTNGDALSLDALLDGDNVALTAGTLAKLQSVELRDQSTGQLAPAAHDVIIYRGGGTELGKIPAGAWSATSEFDIWLPATLDDTTTAATPTTAPAGSSFSRPRTAETAIAVANGGELTAEAAQGIWHKWTAPAAAKARRDIQIIFGVEYNNP